MALIAATLRSAGEDVAYRGPGVEIGVSSFAAGAVAGV
jgi:hypothetical protein